MSTTTTTTATRSDFTDRFPSLLHAVEFENNTLAAITTNMDGIPAEAFDVRDGQVTEPGPDYWAWLIDEHAEQLLDQELGDHE